MLSGHEPQYLERSSRLFCMLCIMCADRARYVHQQRSYWRGQTNINNGTGIRARCPSTRIIAGGGVSIVGQISNALVNLRSAAEHSDVFVYQPRLPPIIYVDMSWYLLSGVWHVLADTSVLKIKYGSDSSSYVLHAPRILASETRCIRHRARSEPTSKPALQYCQ